MDANLILQNVFDSHVHFMATGEVDSGLKLHDLKSAEDIKNLKIQNEHYRQNWLVGFGWDHHKWSSNTLPHKNILDEAFPDTPVFFSRVDGHMSWINQKAIDEFKKLGFNFDQEIVGGKIDKDSSGDLTGLLMDQAHIMGLLKLPPFSREQLEQQALRSMRIFNENGVTHVRDLSMTSMTAEVLKGLYEKNQSTICIEAFVTAESLTDLDRAYADYQSCLKFSYPHLRMKGLKIFVDGSLGSKTAYLSQNYKNENHKGLMSWTADEIRKAIEYAWRKDLDIAIHAIGDESAHIVVTAAKTVAAQGILGHIHLEHAQLLRSETIQAMKPIHITCHMQPCHWLSDYKWLGDVLPEGFEKYLFHWELLRKNKVKFDFGTDSPIEPASLIRNIEALNLSAKHQIPKLGEDYQKYFTHSDSAWCPSKTIITKGKITEVHFGGKRLI